MKFQKRPVHLLGPNYILDRCSFPFPLESSSRPFYLRSYKWHPRVMVRVSDWVAGERVRKSAEFRSHPRQAKWAASRGFHWHSKILPFGAIATADSNFHGTATRRRRGKNENPLNKRIQCCQFVNIHHPSTVNTCRIVFTFYFSPTMYDNDWLLSKLI